MSKKKTSAELEKEIQDLERRIQKKKEEAKKISEAEEAKLRSDIVKAVMEWADALPESERMTMADLPAYFRREAEVLRGKHDIDRSGGEGEASPPKDDDDEFII